MRCRVAIFIVGLMIFKTGAQTISGVVTEAASDQPLISARVIIRVDGSSRCDTILTDATGRWQFTLPTAGVSSTPGRPFEAQLYPNHPNPFNPSTKISFYLPEDRWICLLVYNTRGQEVARKEGWLSAGAYSIPYYSQGAAGVYFYSLQYDEIRLTRKMIQLDGGLDGGFGNFNTAEFPLSSPTLTKVAATDITLICEKFTYWPDTSRYTVTGGEILRTVLRTVHDHAVVLDLHNDVLELMLNDPTYRLKDRHSHWHTDIPRLRQGGVDIQFFVLWPDPDRYGTVPFQTTLNLIEIMRQEQSNNPEDLVQVTTVDAALSEVVRGKIAYFFGVEGGHAIENDLNKLYQLYHAGMRYFTITWNNSTNWAIAAADSRSRTVGLSEFGKQVVRALDSLGVLIDVSHVGIKTIEDILAITKNPIIASHSGVRALRDHYRNLYDEQIRAIANKGGVIGVVFYPPFLVRTQRASVADVVAHIDHIVNIAGIDHVALGSDFDGFSGAGPDGLEDTSKFPNLTLALLQRGYSPAEVEKIFGGNMLRVLRQVCGPPSVFLAEK